MQPIYKDDQGTLRFKENKIVRALLDEAQKRAKFGLNQLSMKNFSQADWEQFYQLIGYSICGYHELSLVSDASCEEASKAAALVAPDCKVPGCRDDNCEIHCGVEKE